MKTVLLLFVLLLNVEINAQPFFFNYRLKSNYSYNYNYEELDNAFPSTATGDDNTEVLNLPFQFNYCGIDYSTIKVSTNGWIQFGATYNEPGFENNLADPQYKNFICPLWDDLIVDGSASISYTTEGAYPARYFKIQWKNVKWKNSNNRKSFQLWLLEYDNSITFFYGPSSGNSPISSSIGITNDIGGINNFISVNLLQPLPTFLTLSDTTSFIISSLDLIPADNLMETFIYPPNTNDLSSKLYQVPDTLSPGEENQIIFSILHFSHSGLVLTPRWMEALKFNTYGTTNTADILRAKLYNTGRSPHFNTNHQMGSTVENPGNVFEIGNLYQAYFGYVYVTYYWLVFDISPGAQPGNIIDATCTKIEAPHPFYYGIPDSSLSSGHHVIGYPLPVELASFSAECNDNDVMLSWTTASETNNKGFQVERRKAKVESNGGDVESFESVGFVNGNGTSTELNHYSFTDENLSAGKYIYRLKQIDYDGSFEYSNEIEIDVNVVNEFMLFQNYPNPFNPSTKIKYSIPLEVKGQSSIVNLKIFDVLGNEVAVLVNEARTPGEYEIEIDAAKYNLSSGVYYYTLTSGSFKQTKKMAIIK